MTTVTFDLVRDETRSWDSDDGKISLEYITVDAVLQQNGTDEIVELSYGAQRDRKDEYVASLRELVGKTEDVEIERKGEYNGVAQYKLKNWPTKPRGAGGSSGGGGGGRGGGDWETAEERRVKNISIETQKAAGILAALTTDNGTSADRLTFVVENVERLARAIHDARTKIAGEGAAVGGSSLPVQSSPATSASPALTDLRARSVDLLKSEARVALRYKQLFGTPKSFDEITETEFVEIIEAAEGEK